MKKSWRYALAFVAGSLVTGTVAYAAGTDTYVQALLGTSTVSMNGKVVANPPKLVYGGTTYVQLYSIQQGLKQAGIIPTWDGSTFNMQVPSFTQTPGSGTPSTPVVNVSSLPYTYAAGNGMELTVNKVINTDTSITFNVTLTYLGSTTGDGSTLLFSNLSAGGKTYTVTNCAQIFLQTKNALYPQQSATGNIVYQPLPSDATQCTLNFSLTGGMPNTQITFDSSK